MSFFEKINNYYNLKKDKINKLTNNKIKDYYNNLQIIFDDQYYSKNIAIYENNKKVIIGKYEILGYYDKHLKIWHWAFNNKYLENYLTKISKKIYDIIKNNKNINFNYNNLDEKLFNLLLDICLYYSEKIWFIIKTDNYNNNFLEVIILTDINQIL